MPRVRRRGPSAFLTLRGRGPRRTRRGPAHEKRIRREGPRTAGRARGDRPERVAKPWTKRRRRRATCRATRWLIHTVDVAAEGRG
ncbi:hypothetical protein PSMK_24650 [Phycisphaera mikurensis NBRC 102666]|uniref:Uncharacterized protein n=1 Tax=Phycisphaera mikurensis (strain NBRC 102666 / KCTC 22515 / FYK2301M01) TaxID=1142394 RepID=I0IH86_PHYMF|nr:hypothetical protein PSMK_24650 [Phycisphaera mikurensis NBRC 102666]